MKVQSMIGVVVLLLVAAPSSVKGDDMEECTPFRRMCFVPEESLECCTGWCQFIIRYIGKDYYACADGPTEAPSVGPSSDPSGSPSSEPSVAPSGMPSLSPSDEPSPEPTLLPSVMPSSTPSAEPSSVPSSVPSAKPSWEPSNSPSAEPSIVPSFEPSVTPSAEPTSLPSASPSVVPSTNPTACLAKKKEDFCLQDDDCCSGLLCIGETIRGVFFGFCLEPDEPSSMPSTMPSTMPSPHLGGPNSACFGTSAGGSSGDPHITTFDGLFYDCQPPGEYILAKSLDPEYPMLIQTRTVGFAPIQISVNDAYAVKIGKGSPIYEIRPVSPGDNPDDASLVGSCRKMFLVDETPFALNDGYSDAFVTITSDGWIYFKFTDPKVEMKLYCSSVLVTIPEELCDVTGLLGNRDGTRTNDWLSRTGTAFDLPVDLRGDEADEFCSTNWCVVDEEESLFSYHGDFDFEAGCVWLEPPGERVNTDEAPDEIRQICGTNRDCILDGIVLGTEGAQQQIDFEGDLAEARSASGRIRFEPVRVEAAATTIVSITVNVSDSDPALLSGLEAFAVYRLLESGARNTTRVASLSRVGLGVYSGSVGVFASTAGVSFGFQAFPVYGGITEFGSPLAQEATAAVVSFLSLPGSPVSMPTTEPTQRPSAWPSVAPTGGVSYIPTVGHTPPPTPSFEPSLIFATPAPFTPTPPGPGPCSEDICSAHLECCETYYCCIEEGEAGTCRNLDDPPCLIAD